MPPPRRFASVLAYSHLPIRARAGLLAAEVRRRVRPRESYRVRYGSGSLFLSQDDYEIDWETLKHTLADEPYLAEYAGAVVLDIGAHKGYFGAYALIHGARTVVSYEPEPVNAGFLERSARTFRGHWQVEQAAISATAGQAELHVMSASWGHALHPPREFEEYETGIERVPVLAMTDVLRGAGAVGHRLVVKINTEGEECETVLGTPAEEWIVVDELLVETHPWAGCGAEELAAHLVPAGLRSVPSRHERMLQLRRAQPRSESRTASR
jgi:FkbM family methyltransferase